MLKIDPSSIHGSSSSDPENTHSTQDAPQQHDDSSTKISDEKKPDPIALLGSRQSARSGRFQRMISWPSPNEFLFKGAKACEPFTENRLAIGPRSEQKTEAQDQVDAKPLRNPAIDAAMTNDSAPRYPVEANPLRNPLYNDDERLPRLEEHARFGRGNTGKNQSNPLYASMTAAVGMLSHQPGTKNRSEATRARLLQTDRETAEKNAAANNAHDVTLPAKFSDFDSEVQSIINQHLADTNPKESLSFSTHKIKILNGPDVPGAFEIRRLLTNMNALGKPYYILNLSGRKMVIGRDITFSGITWSLLTKEPTAVQPRFTEMKACDPLFDLLTSYIQDKKDIFLGLAFPDESGDTDMPAALADSLRFLGFYPPNTLLRCKNFPQFCQLLQSMGCVVEPIDLRNENTDNPSRYLRQDIEADLVLSIGDAKGKPICTMLWSQCTGRMVGRNMERGNVFQGTPLEFHNQEIIAKNKKIIGMIQIAVSDTAANISLFTGIKRQAVQHQLSVFFSLEGIKDSAANLDFEKVSQFLSQRLKLKIFESETYYFPQSSEADIEKMVATLQHSPHNLLVHCKNLNEDESFHHIFIKAGAKKEGKTEGEEQIKGLYYAGEKLEESTFDSFGSYVNSLLDPAREMDQDIDVSILSLAPLTDVKVTIDESTDTPAIRPADLDDSDIPSVSIFSSNSA